MALFSRKNKRARRSPDLGKDPLLPLILRFSLPAIFSYFISELYNMVDTYFVGNGVGPIAIGALGAVFPVQRLVIALSLLFAFATANRMAFHQGEGEIEEAKTTVHTGLLLNFIVMIPYTLLVFFLRWQILPFLGAKGGLLEPAVEYVSIIIWGSVFLTLSTTMARILLTLGYATLSMWLTSLGALINIVLDEIFVMRMHMGIRGAAYATVISQIGCFLITWIFYRRVARKRKIGFKLAFSAKRFLFLMHQGMPSFIVESEDAVVMAILNLLLFKLGGEDGVNVMAMNTKVYMFLFVLILGFAYGMQAIIAYNTGAGNHKRIRETLHITLILSIVAGIVSTVIFYIFAESLLGIFVNDAHLISLCVPTFRRMIIGLPLLSLYYVSVMYFTAKGYARAATILTLLRQIMILIPLALIFVYIFNVSLFGLFNAYPLTDLIAAAIAGLILLKALRTTEIEGYR